MRFSVAVDGVIVVGCEAAGVRLVDFGGLSYRSTAYDKPHTISAHRPVFTKEWLDLSAQKSVPLDQHAC